MESVLATYGKNSRETHGLRDAIRSFLSPFVLLWSLKFTSATRVADLRAKIGEVGERGQ